MATDADLRVSVCSRVGDAVGALSRDDGVGVVVDVM